MGGWITLSSYNKFTNKCNWDVFLIGIGNALTSFYAGFVIFSVVGYMAEIKGLTNMDNVTAQGPGLAFVAYPEGLAMIPGAPLWSVCFFFMMFTVGLDSLFGQVEVIAAGIIDEYPEYLRPRRKVFTLVLCCIMFMMGIPLVTQGGIYVVTLLDWYTLLFSFSIISLTEIVVIIYIYGYNQFATDIEVMIGSKPALFFKVTWLFVTPVTLVCVVIFLATSYAPVYYGDYTFPDYAVDIGWAIAIVPTIGIIPAVMIFQFFWNMDFQANVWDLLLIYSSLKAFLFHWGFCTESASDNPYCKRRFINVQIRYDTMILCKSGNCAAIKEEFIEKLILPTEDWGPALSEHRDKYDLVSPSRRQSQQIGERRDSQRETVFEMEEGNFSQPDGNFSQPDGNVSQPDGNRAVRFAGDDQPPSYSAVTEDIQTNETIVADGSAKTEDDRDTEQLTKVVDGKAETDDVTV